MGKLTARDEGAAPLPAGRETPGPDVRPVDKPAPALFPRRVLGSAGGADSTDSDTIWAPRTMVRPRVRFSSVSTVWVLAPGAAGLACFFLLRRNSSVSASTRFMCCESKVSLCPSITRNQRGSSHTLSKASICPVIWRPSNNVTLIR